MSVKLSKKRTHTFYDKNDSEVSVTLELKFYEDRDYSLVSNLLRDTVKNIKDSKLAEEKAEEILASNFNNIQYSMLRKSIVECTGFIDEDGNPISIKNSDGIIDEYIQKMVFEYVRKNVDMYEEINEAFNGLSLKN